MVYALACPLANAQRPVRAMSAAAMPVAHRITHNDRGDSPTAGPHRSASRRQPSIAPGQAARRASDRYGGRVLNVVLERSAGRPYYRVTLLDAGRIRVVHIDAR